MSAASRPAAVGVEVFANLFQAIVEEMAWIALRSSHTTFVKETQDFSVGLITPEGEMFATPHGTGAPSNACTSMRPGTRAFDDWAPGDTLLTNDPYTTGGMVMHLNDVYLFRPVFVEDRLLCFAWAFIHATHIGGSAPGSIDMRNHEIHQEGIRLRPLKLHEKGVLNRQLWDILADNSRIPSLNQGDITALLAALDRPERRVARLARRHGRDRVAWAMRATLDTTERQARNVLRRIPAGAYRFVEYFEDDYVSELPVRLEVCLRSDGRGGVELDYTGSDPQVAAALNLPTGGQRHHPFLSLAVINLVVTHAPHMHFNAGLIRGITLKLPERSVVNASFPASCGMRYSTALRCHDLVLGALAQAVPEMVTASGSGLVVITYVSTSELGRQGRVVVANALEGGAGGGLGLDGISGVSFGAAYVRNVPVEVLESEAPVVVRASGMRPDTEGAGALRGGFGMEYALQIRHPSAVVVMRGIDRHRFSCWGAGGGRAGAVGGTAGVRRDGETVEVGKATVYRPELGEVLRIAIGGGGGLGDPLDRDPARVLADHAAGLVSTQRAADAYGVVIEDGAVDEAATARRRADRRGAARDGFDLGPGRTAWEERFGAVADHLAHNLGRVPGGVRREVYRRLAAAGEGPYDAARAETALREVIEELGPTAGRE